MKVVHKMIFYGIGSCLLMPLLGKKQGDEKKREKDRHVQIITSTHVRAFSRDNLFSKRIEQEDFAIWEDSLKEVKNYVAANEPKGLVGKKHEYSDAIKALLRISEKMINTIKVGYNHHVQKALPKEAPDAAVEEKRAALHNYVKEQLEEARGATKKLVDLLGEKREKLKNKKTKERYVVDVVYTLALTIEATLAKCINDTKKVPKKAFLKK